MGEGALAPGLGWTGSDVDGSVGDADRVGSDTDTPGSNTDTCGTDTCGTDNADAFLAGCGGTARLVAGAWCRARAAERAGDVGAGTGAAAMAGTDTAAAPAPVAGVAGGSFLVGSAVAARGAAATDTVGRDAAGAETAAVPVTGDAVAALGMVATAAPAPDAFTAAEALSMALWAVDKPTCATDPGDTVTSACAACGRTMAATAITDPIAFGAPRSGRPRLVIV